MSSGAWPPTNQYHRVRIKLFLLLRYLILPLDLVPDFLPLIGYADYVIIIGLVLRPAGSGPLA